MQVTQDMIEWAKRRVYETAESAQLAQNAYRTAERDLAGLQCGKPTGACIDRWCDSRSNASALPPQRSGGRQEQIVGTLNQKEGDK